MSTTSTQKSKGWRDLGFGFAMRDDCMELRTAIGDVYQRDGDAERLHTEGRSAGKLFLFGPMACGTYYAVPRDKDKHQRAYVVALLRRSNGALSVDTI